MSSIAYHSSLTLLSELFVLAQWKVRALVGRLSLDVGWEDGPEWGLKTVSFNP